MKVDALPRRTAHVVHALMVAGAEKHSPVTAAEVCIYDAEALTVRHTAAALTSAQRLGLAAHGGPYWFATNYANARRTEFEDRFLREDTAGREEKP